MKNMNLPNNWKTIKFGDLFSFEKKSKHKASEGKENGKFMYFTSSNSQSKSVDFFDFDGEYLIFGTGGNASIHCPSGRFSTSGDCLVAKIKNTKVLTKYVYRYLTANIYLLEAGFKGAGLKHISKTYIQNIKIPYLENVEVQKKIVAILEKAERLKEWRKEADRLTDEFLKSTYLELFGDPIINKNKWNFQKLEELGTWQSGGTPSRSNANYFKGDIPWYTSGELNFLFVADSIEKITEDAIEESAAKIIPPNSLLFGMYDTAALKSSITTIDCACNQAIAFSKLEFGLINIFYLYYTIQIARKYYMRQQRGVRQKNLNLSMIKNFYVPVPPLNLQNKFANIVQQIEHMRKHQLQSKQYIDDLFNTLIQKAFKRKLVN